MLTQTSSADKVEPSFHVKVLHLFIICIIIFDTAPEGMG